jgi:hypothetical protein
MAMARTGYSMQVEGEDIARAKANEVDISPKHAFEIARRDQSHLNFYDPKDFLDAS